MYLQEVKKNLNNINTKEKHYLSALDFNHSIPYT